MSAIVQVDIELLGRHFTIGTPDHEKETLLEAVRLLKSKVEIIQQGGRVMDVDKVAIMAALNIAHDLLKIKVGGGLEMESFQRRIRQMCEVSDDALSTGLSMVSQATPTKQDVTTPAPQVKPEVVTPAPIPMFAEPEPEAAPDSPHLETSAIERSMGEVKLAQAITEPVSQQAMFDIPEETNGRGSNIRFY